MVSVHLVGLAAVLTLWHPGVECCVFAATVYVLLQRAPNHGSRNAMLAYVSVLFAITTVGTGAGMKWAELVWIDDRGFPGGPAAYILEEFSNPMNILSFASYIVGNFMTDLLIVSIIFLQHPTTCQKTHFSSALSLLGNMGP